MGSPMRLTAEPFHLRDVCTVRSAGKWTSFRAMPWVLLLASCAPPTTAPLATAPMVIGGNTFTMEIADNDATREHGLMKRSSLPADRGMVFVFPTPGPYQFWMKDTWIDLDIIWLSPAGRIVSIVTMQANDLKSQGPAEPAQYIIELNAGAAEMLHLRIGDSIAIPPKILQPAGG